MSDFHYRSVSLLAVWASAVGMVFFSPNQASEIALCAVLGTYCITKNVLSRT